jgi:hypothetical protein
VKTHAVDFERNACNQATRKERADGIKVGALGCNSAEDDAAADADDEASEEKASGAESEDDAGGWRALAQAQYQARIDLPDPEESK